MELRVKIPRSLNTGCSPSFHWLLCVRKDLSRSAGFKLATVMSFKVDELKKKKKDNLVTPLGLSSTMRHVQGSHQKAGGKKFLWTQTLIWSPPPSIPPTVHGGRQALNYRRGHTYRQTNRRVDRKCTWAHTHQGQLALIPRVRPPRRSLSPPRVWWGRSVMYNSIYTDVAADRSPPDFNLLCIGHAG